MKISNYNKTAGKISVTRLKSGFYPSRLPVLMANGTVLPAHARPHRLHQATTLVWNQRSPLTQTPDGTTATFHHTTVTASHPQHAEQTFISADRVAQSCISAIAIQPLLLRQNDSCSSWCPRGSVGWFSDVSIILRSVAAAGQCSPVMAG